MVEATPTRQFNHIVRSYISPPLISHGFIKTGNNYVLQNTALSWIVDIQRSRWNDAAELQFTLNCGIFVPGVLSAYRSQPEPKRPSLSDCCISARIGMLSASRLDKWWKLTSADLADEPLIEIGRDLQQRLRDDIFPFLGCFDTPQDVLLFLTKPRDKRLGSISPQSSVLCLGYAGILHWLMGAREESRRMLDAAVAAEKRGGVEPYVASVRARLFG